MVRGRSGGSRRPTTPLVGSIITGMVVGDAKKGVIVELGTEEVLLPRSRYGAAQSRIEELGYGDAITVEVVADLSRPDGVGLTRVGIERSLRQPREIEGRVVRDGSTFALAPADGSAPFAVVLLDRFDPGSLVDTTARWLVGAPHRDRRFVLPSEP